jgi:RNA 3'-terminal phosphate cyclase
MIRSSLALGTILSKSFTLHSIRKSRPNPGINNQLRSVFSAFTKHPPQVGSTEVTIYPHFKWPTVVHSSTPASIALMLQCFVPVFASLRYQKSVKIEGGTDVSKSPCQESLVLGLFPLMWRMGV